MFLMSLVSASFMPKKAPGHVELVDLSGENKHRRPLHRLESSSRKEHSVPRTRGFRSTTCNNNVHDNNNGDVATTPITTSTGPSQTGAGRIAPYLPTNPINSTTLQKNEESSVVINSKPSKSQTFPHNDEEDIDVVWKEVVIDKLRCARQAARQRSHYASSSRKQKEASSVIHHPLASPEDGEESKEKNREPAYLQLESLFAYIDEPGSPASSEDGDGGASVGVEDLRMHHMGSPTNSSLYATVHPSPPKPCEPEPSSVLRIGVPTLETLETVESRKRKTHSVSKDFQEVEDGEEGDDAQQQLGFGQQFEKGSFLEPHPSQKTLRAVATNKGNNLFHNKLSSPPNNNDDTECNTIMGEGEVPHEYPSPSSITCDLSPHSVYSDDQHSSVVEPFHHMGNAGSLGLDMFSRFPVQNGMCCGSPTSVLSQEQGDEMPHLMSDSSEPVEPKEPKDRIRRRQSSASTFQSRRREGEENQVNSNSELRYFREAENWEPWLASSKDGDVLDPSDLDFLLPPDFQFKEQMLPDTQVEEICGKMEVLKISPGGSPRFGNKTSHHSQWVPYGTSTQGLQSPKGGSSRRQSLPQVFSQISKTIEKLAIGSNSKRTVNSAPDLVNVEPPQSPYQSPSASPIAMKDTDEDENISPSVSSWEVEGEVEDNSGPSNMTPRRRWRRSNAEEDSKLPSPTRTHRFSSRPRSTSFVPSKAKRRSTMPLVPMPCSGRLFSWPHRMMAFKVSKSKFLDSDDERESVDGEHSFGGSAHRNAQQVRRILRSSQKRFANLTNCFASTTDALCSIQGAPSYSLVTRLS